MADVVVTITISAVSYKTWLNTSLVGLSTVVGGVPMIELTEMGPDQEDAFANYNDEACREVLKIFVSRQGDAAGTPFEKTSTEVIYRFAEEQPPLPHAASIKATLYEDVKNAIYTFITYMWFKIKNNEEMSKFLDARYHKLTDNIENALFKLHD
jgi:hypothetical protein